MMWLLAALLVSPAAGGHRLAGSPSALSCCTHLGFAAGAVRLTLEEGTLFWLRLQGKGSQVRKCLFIRGSSSQCGQLWFHCRQEERQNLPLSVGLRGRRRSLLGLGDRISVHPWLSLQGPRDFTKTWRVGLLSGQNFQINGLIKWET